MARQHENESDDEDADEDADEGEDDGGDADDLLQLHEERDEERLRWEPPPPPPDCP